ncbi:hypothetical protein ACRE_074000 [Hapsidospora chrysogenum ATCC 11550]|uniref:Uncharacterized protein n=1 Tax=Hapsidospora chrysogenum (strain ATCC 11550 / CBS 779.69 / DSM 880 / IAM 14645 / JCM 23072 / IMI 49137) TaxID=857340 RepID=A0A086SXP3_HAPC1|nr:hypothetical protein ACRE_074000 [Hapsidospora chrysogenum ATCC 11550]
MLARTLIASLLATGSLAAPRPATSLESSLTKHIDIPKNAAGMPLPLSEAEQNVDLGVWTIQELNRTCDGKDTVCQWHFLVNTHKQGTKPYRCMFKVEGERASKTPVTVPRPCEVLEVTTGYDEPGKFTVITPVHRPSSRIIYAGYNDSVLTNGTTVRDEDWAVEYLPGHEQ